MNIHRPTLILDPNRCLRNLKRMHSRAASAGTGFRPHFKTHQSIAIGRWFREEGIDCITVSSLDMAEYFAGDGWSDILVAFALNPLELERYNQLGSRCQLATLIDNSEALEMIAGKLRQPLGFYVDIDTGYHRTGISPEDTGSIGEIIERAAEVDMLRFRGFYCHPGDTYKHLDRAAKEAIHARSIAALATLKQRFSAHNPEVLMGDTPGCSLTESYPGVDAITPGNFIFYDLFQHSIGSCAEDDIAVAMACPVVGRYPDRNEVVIHGGSAHFSKDAVSIGGRTVFGKLAARSGSTWKQHPGDHYLHSLSQEHGIIRLPAEDFRKVGIGDLLYFLPAHSCLTAIQMGEYLATDGRVLDHM
jgi:D-serine deaminase-like pyridoxal phosphate-dependent protein